MSNDDSESKNNTISIPNSLAEKIKKRMKGTDFSSMSEYVTFILRKVIFKIESDEEKREAFSKEEEAKVKERLRNLGYID
ncbi:MAG: CopG family transcriptional regulator [Candidatus Helarchaeota archaeon]|nr:CopG family transcriptional regulator [Candidatus Helarchaeota archaeon]